MARVGYGYCPHQNIDIGNGNKSRSVVISHQRLICEKFEAAEPLAVSTRIEWLGRQGAKK